MTPERVARAVAKRLGGGESTLGLVTGKLQWVAQQVKGKALHDYLLSYVREIALFYQKKVHGQDGG